MSLNPELERRWRDIGSVTPPHHSLLPSTPASSPSKVEDALSVVVSLNQEHGGYRVTMTTKQGSFEGFSTSDATIDCWAGAGKTQVYIALPRITWTIRPPFSGLKGRVVSEEELSEEATR
jgi:hypothetical protein